MKEFDIGHLLGRLLGIMRREPQKEKTKQNIYNGHSFKIFSCEFEGILVSFLLPLRMPTTLALFFDTDGQENIST